MRYTVVKTWTVHCRVFEYMIGSGGSLQFTIAIMTAAAVIKLFIT